jgi:membrane fusion protein, heavy metal efflux system
MKFNWKLPFAVILIAAGVTGVTVNRKTRAQVILVWNHLAHGASHEEAPSDKSWIEASTPSTTPWDRTVQLSDSQIKSIGLETRPVVSQTEPTILSLGGTTEYDPAAVTTVRLQFDSRVDTVLVDLGSVVKEGDPLLELFSTDLATAKSSYELAISQYNRDKKVYDYKMPLARDGTIAGKEAIEVENDEAQSRLKMKLAKDNLLVYGLTEREIEHSSEEDGKEKARMTLRARAGGTVVEKHVVPSNYYDSKDTLLTIAKLDKLWVWGGVSELDADKVEVNQTLKVIFPFSNREVTSKIAYIDKAIDPNTRSAKFRTTITNPDGKLKAGEFVKVLVQIPPRPGQTVIPRAAMISVDRLDYVFVLKPGKVATFERRPIVAAKESNDVVVVARPTEGHRELLPGEQVATLGSLILEKIYEDRLMAEGGLLVSDPAHRQLDRSSSPPNIVVRSGH